MIHDPDFGYDQKSKPPVGRRRRWWRRWLLYPLLCLSGCHMLMTGSPVPLWSLEYLDHPVKVTSISDDGLRLADGRLVRLPLIKRLPCGELCFRQALTSGLEVKADGEVFGLFWITRRPCANDPYLWVRRRINLTDLAGGLDPSAIDDATMPREAIDSLKEKIYGEPEPGSWVIPHIASQMRRIREDIRHRPDPNPVYVIEVDRHPTAPAGDR